MVFSALWLLCSHVCSMFYWLMGNALLIYYVTVNLRLHIPWIDMCWEFRCGWVGVVSVLQAEEQLVCSCGMWGLGVNGSLKYGVNFSWSLFRDEFSFSVKGLDVVLLVRNEQAV